MELISRLTAGMLLLFLSPLLIIIGIVNLVIQGTPVPAKAIEKNKNVSTIDPIDDDANGATYHLFFLNLSNI